MENNPIVITNIEFSDFSGTPNQPSRAELNLSEELIILAEIELNMTAVLGTRSANFGEINSYKIGDIIEVERMAGHHVDVYIGSEKIAIGEIVPMGDNFALIVNEVISKNGDFLKNLNKDGELE